MSSENTNILFDLIFEKCKNVYLSGVGGTGKSYQLKNIFDEANKKQINTFLTSSTGISAFLIGGSTIHSWAGVVLPSYVDTEEKFKDVITHRIKKIKKNRILLDRWLNTKLLLIDEISMIGLNYFELLNIIAKSIRNNNLPFGGIQLVLSGDMCQLPPVNDEFIFHSDCWKELNLSYVNLSKAWRFTDEKYIHLLQRLRLSNHNEEDIKSLHNRNITKFKSSDYENAVHIYPLKKQVESHNKNELNNLKEMSNIFIAKDTIKSFLHSKEIELKDEKDLSYDSIFTVPKKLELKEGCRVMLLCNLNPQEGLVNGSVGRIEKFITDIKGDTTSIEVFFFSVQKSYLIERFSFVYDDIDNVITRNQFPLILSYAVSVHKIQGSTLDKVVLDIGGNIFENGQTYVALSRCKNIDSLFIKNFTPHKIKTNRECISFEKELLKNSIIL